MRRPRQFALLLFIVSGAWSAAHVEILVAQVALPRRRRGSMSSSTMCIRRSTVRWHVRRELWVT
jgi:hypothetical protein